MCLQEVDYLKYDNCFNDLSKPELRWVRLPRRSSVERRRRLSFSALATASYLCFIESEAKPSLDGRQLRCTNQGLEMFVEPRVKPSYTIDAEGLDESGR